MTVRELLKHLQKVPLDAKVVTFDHFGRPIDLDRSSFYQHEQTPKHAGSPNCPDGHYLAVTTPDIGPEPD